MQAWGSRLQFPVPSAIAAAHARIELAEEAARAGQPGDAAAHGAFAALVAARARVEQRDARRLTIAVVAVGLAVAAADRLIDVGARLRRPPADAARVQDRAAHAGREFAEQPGRAPAADQPFAPLALAGASVAFARMQGRHARRLPFAVVAVGPVVAAAHGRVHGRARVRLRLADTGPVRDRAADADGELAELLRVASQRKQRCLTAKQPRGTRSSTLVADRKL